MFTPTQRILGLDPASESGIEDAHMGGHICKGEKGRGKLEPTHSLVRWCAKLGLLLLGQGAAVVWQTSPPFVRLCLLSQ